MSQKQLLSDGEIGIYDHNNLILCVFRQIKNELSENNYKLIQKYDREMVNCSLSKATRHKNLKMILSLSRILKKDWGMVTKNDIDDLVYEVMGRYSGDSGKETNTTWDHKKILKIFVRWVKLGSRSKEEVGDPPEVKGVKIRKVQDKIVREDLLTEEDKTKILHACGENARDRAFIDCHFEAGTRPGEILNLQIRHVKFDKFGAVLHVDGKTGPRPIRLVRATPSLAAWMSVHPLKDDTKAPLWPNLSYHKFGQPLAYAGARMMVKKRCKKANLSKRVYLNLFRHSEATSTANFMTEAQMRKRHGWSSDSRMPSKYVHLVNSDVENAIFAHYGIKDEEKKKNPMPEKCQYCQVQNSPDSKICVKCGKPLSLDVTLEIDEENKSEITELKEQMTNLREQNAKQISEIKTGFEMILDYIYERKPKVSKKPKTVVRSPDGAILYHSIQ